MELRSPVIQSYNKTIFALNQMKWSSTNITTPSPQLHLYNIDLYSYLDLSKLFVAIPSWPMLLYQQLLDPSWGFFWLWPWSSMIDINDNFKFWPTISPIVIDGNTHTLSLSPPIIMLLPLSLCSLSLAPPVIMLLPLSWCSSIFISLFDISGKGNAFWCSHVSPFGEEITPNLSLRYSKFSLGRGLMKMSAIFSFVSTYSNLTFFSVTYSLRKWNLIGICFVLECINGFLEMFIALVLPQSIGMGTSYFTYMSSKVWFIQITWVQHVVAAIYSTSAFDKDTEFFFLLDQYTRQSPK